MPLVPYHRFRIALPIPAHEAEERLAAHVRPITWRQPDTVARPFWGVVGGGRFRCWRAGSARSITEAVFRGRFVPTAQGCRVQGAASVHPFLWVFLGLAFSAPPGLPREWGLPSLGVVVVVYGVLIAFFSVSLHADLERLTHVLTTPLPPVGGSGAT